VRAALTALALACGAAHALSGPYGPADFATRVLAYDSTNGTPGYDDPLRAVGPPSEDAIPMVPDNTAVVSFGPGGFLTLGFDRPITDDPRHPGGYDFVIFGNAFYIGGDESTVWRRPGYVEVGVDPSGRHEYGDGSAVQWYWLKGDPAPDTLAGFPIPTGGYDTKYIGYANATPTDGSGDPLIPNDPNTPGIGGGSAGGDAFDLAWAVDGATGQPVRIATVDFVRIHCATDSVHPVFGRSRTQIDAVSLVRPRIPGDVDMDGAVALNDALEVTRALQGKTTLTAEQRLRGDTAGDGGDLTAADAATILRWSAGLS
jgi:hypothetical protein